MSDRYDFLPEKRGIRTTFRGMYMTTILLTVVIGIAVIAIAISYLTDGIWALDLMAASFVVIVLVMGFFSVRTLVANFITSADFVIAKDGVTVLITEKIKRHVSSEQLAAATIESVKPKSGFHPDKEGDTVSLVCLAEPWLPFTLTASYYRARGKSGFVITSDHEKYKTLLGRLT